MSFFETTKLTNEQSDIINAVDEEVIILLRRMVKLLEPSGVVDSAFRQSVSIANSIYTYGSYNAPYTNIPTQYAPTLAGAALMYTPTWAGPIDPRWTNLDQARISYNLGIRNNLIFT